MSTETPADGGDIKPPVAKKDAGNSNQPGRRQQHRDHQKPFPKKERFQGAHPDLTGCIFTSSTTRANQISIFTKTDERIKALVGQKYDPHVLKSLESGTLSLPPEPTAVTDANGVITEIEKMKYGKRYDKFLNLEYTIQTGLKQVYSIYYGQCDDEMKATLAEHPDFERANVDKDVLSLYKILQSVNYSYTNSEEPMLTMWMAKKNFMGIKQGKHQTVNEYYETFIGMKDVNETLNTNIHDDLGVVDIIAREEGKDLSAMNAVEKKAYSDAAYDRGRDRMLAIHFLCGSDRERYGGLLKDLRHNYLMNKKNEYPKNLQAAYVLLKGWNKGKTNPGGKQLLGVAFNTNGDDEGTSLLNNGSYSGPPCGRCGRANHPTAKCHAKTHENGTVLHIDTSFTVEEQVSTNDMFGTIGSDAHGLMFNINSDGRGKQKLSSRQSAIPKTWILLDSQSTIDVFSNPDLLENIHPINTTMHIKCNAGSKSTNLRGYVSGYGWVWYYPEGIANILSLSHVKERFRVTFDSATDNCFHVHKEDAVLKFREAARRLYYFDTAERDEDATLLVTTVSDNESKFSAYDVSRAKLARLIQKRIGRPSTQDYIRFVSSNLIPNCPITVQDIKTAEIIYGPDLGSLKGKTVRKASPVVRPQTTSIPLGIMQKYQDVTLSIDIMKVCGIPFFNTISRHIKFGSAGRLEDMSNKTILSHLKIVISVYCVRGFRVTIILADNQFESMRGDIANLGAIVNVVSRDEHVPEIERYNRTIKDRVRSQYNVLPFDFIPPVMVVELVYSQVFWRNMFALKGGISLTQSPSEIILNRKLDFNAHCKVEFGDYVQTHEEHDNSMDSRTVGAIATRPTGNSQGGYYFIRLDTGRRINRKDWTPLPMPDLVKDQVHRLARRAKANKKLTFTNLKNEDLDILYANTPGIDDDDLNDEPAGVVDAGDDEDSDDDSNYYAALDDDDDESDDSDADDSSDDDDNSDENEEESDETDETAGVEPSLDVNPETDAENAGVDEGPEDETAVIEDMAVETAGVAATEDVAAETAGVDEGSMPTIEEEEEEDVSDENDDESNSRTYQGMKLRSQARKEYNVFNIDGSEAEELVLLTMDQNDEIYELDMLDAEYLFLTESLGWKEALEGEEAQHEMTQDEQKCLSEYLLVTEQMGWRKGLKVFEEKGEHAIMKELKQIHDVEGFQPKHWHELTEEERAAALKYLMYLKEKRDGRIKGRGCADGRPQRLYTNKSESSSPTASLAGVMTTCVIDAYEERDVATVDIPGAFLQTKLPPGEKKIHVVLDDRMAELLAKISPETYEKYVAHKRGKKFIYCELTVALYGTLMAALLFWMKLTKSLKMRGFEINPYDWCIANKTIDGSQCTIVWHVDDLKISHKKSSVVDGIIASLKSEYEVIGEMTVKRGKQHTYLGMDLDFSKPKKFTVSMESYLEEVFDEVKDVDIMQGVASTPAADHLFKTRDNAEKLDEETADQFHSLVAKLQWVTQRGRPDIHVGISFLQTRVRAPDIDDYKKLARVIKYLRRTKFLRLTMEATHLDQNHWFIDGAFAVHDDMRSHTGSFMTFGRGMMNGNSTKQKINTTSSTEAEVVAVHDTMPSILWTKYFLEAQGYSMRPSIIHQDNQSAMLLETNGRGSSSKRTRHMNIRYFFVADCQARNQVIITYCPTDEMIGDFFTKPLGGAKFRRFRNIIMNCDVDEYGQVDIDELTRVHFQRVDGCVKENGTNKDDGKDFEPTSYGSKMVKLVSSQECVGKPTNAEWALRRLARKKVGVRPPTRIHPKAGRNTYAQAAAE